MIVRDFNILASDFHSKVRGRTLALNSMVALAQDALICRIANFPTTIARNAIQKNPIPKILIRSKQIFEGIFTYLQSHPCYLITWLKKVLTGPAQLRGVIYRIYGKTEMKDNPRVINTLTVIARKILDEECAAKTFEGLTALGQEDSLFRPLFIIIMESQSQNKRAQDLVLRGMVHRMRDYCTVEGGRKADKDREVVLTPDDLKRVMIETMNDILESLQEMDSEDVFHELTTRESQSYSLQILSLMHYAHFKLVEKAKERYNIPEFGDDDSDEGGEEGK